MFSSLLFFMILLLMLFMVFFINFDAMIFSYKMIYLGLNLDLEMTITVWNYLFFIMVIFISTSVLFFSSSYMSAYPVQNFLFLYFMFVFSMGWLILNSNFYWMMLGWDGLGVVSFMLIVFYNNVESVNNGLFTIFQNRIGDVFFVLFLLGLMNMSMVSNLTSVMMSLFLIFGAAVKSAQFPFNSWLLAAMSAPTPISSLVHSSTLVVAGVYILLQYSYCLMDYLFVLKFVSWVTLILSTFGLLNESDMKKLIAYSTMSHVGLMMFMYSMQLYKIVYFHLNIHAMFKSLMFMCFGFSMLASYHSQDYRLVSYQHMNPLIKSMYYYACLCLMGLPFLSAFFSKDFIIEKSMEISVEMSEVFFLLVFLGVSVYYSMKLLKLYETMFVFVQKELQFIGGVGLFLMILISVLMINLFISLVFSVSFEIFSYKVSVYLIMMGFVLANLIVKLNYKIMAYTKISNFYELWVVNFYQFDNYMYWTMHSIVQYTNYLMSIKNFLLMNWWVMILIIWFI